MVPGTGTLTKHLTEVLEENQEVLVEYFVTDISVAFATGAASSRSCQNCDNLVIKCSDQRSHCHDNSMDNVVTNERYPYRESSRGLVRFTAGNFLDFALAYVPILGAV